MREYKKKLEERIRNEFDFKTFQLNFKENKNTNVLQKVRQF